MTLAPYARVGTVELYCADALALLADGFPALSRALVITDPLYNIGFDFGAEVSDERPPDVYADECRRWLDAALAEARAVAFTPGAMNLSMWHAIRAPLWEMSWYRPNSNARSPWGRSKWEPVLVYGDVPYSGRDDVIIAPIDYEDPRISWHPCPKPYAWAEGLITRLAESEHDTIVDFFAGSGTVLVQALRMGLRAVGCELQERYCEPLARLLEEIYAEVES